MKRYWYKTFVSDILSQERMQMPHWLFHRLVEFEAIAADYGEDGLLPPVKEMAWVLRPAEETKITETLIALSEVGEVEQSPEGWRLTKFKDRQKSESYDRVKKFREGRNAVKRSVTDETEVADEALLSPLLSSSSSSNSLSEGEGTGEGAVFAAYQNNIGMLTPAIADALKADIDDYTQDWVLAAIEYAVKQEKRSLAYVEGVLKGWKRDGLKDPRKQSEKSKNGAKHENRKTNHTTNREPDPEQWARDEESARLIRAQRAAKQSTPR